MGLKVTLYPFGPTVRLTPTKDRIVLFSPVISGPSGGGATLPDAPTDLEITTGTEPALRSWSVLRAKFAFTSWLAAWATATLGSAAYTASTAYDAAGAAGAVQNNLNTHTGDVAPHFGAISQVDAEAGTSTSLGWWSALRVRQAIAAWAAGVGAGANRVTSAADADTLTINCATTDIAKLTALTGALTIANPTGTPTDTQPLMIELKGDGGAITYGDQFVNRGATKPATATSGKWLRICCEWNAAVSTWDVVAVVTEA